MSDEAQYLKNVENGRIFNYTSRLAEKPGMIRCDEEGNVLDKAEEAQGIDFWRAKCRDLERQLADTQDKLAEEKAMTAAMKRAEPEQVDIEDLIEDISLSGKEKEFNGFTYSEICASVEAMTDKAKLQKWAEDEENGLGLKIDGRMGLEKMKAEILEQSGVDVAAAA